MVHSDGFESSLFDHLVKFHPVVGHHQTVVTGFPLGAMVNQFATEELPIVAKGIADDVPTTRQSEEEGQAAVLEELPVSDAQAVLMLEQDGGNAVD